MGDSVGLRAGLRAAGVLVAMTFATQALADCYVVLGCTDTDLFSKNFGYLVSAALRPRCDFLYSMRNRIYAQHGYCFTTARGKSEIGNQGCHIHDQAALPLNSIERANIATILKAERAKSCQS